MLSDIIERNKLYARKSRWFPRKHGLMENITRVTDPSRDFCFDYSTFKLEIIIFDELKERQK